MKFFFCLVGWCLLLVLCWPLAILVLLLFPLVWLVSLPFRLAFYVVEGALALVKALFLLPARIFRGSRPRTA